MNIFGNFHKLLTIFKTVLLIRMEKMINIDHS